MAHIVIEELDKSFGRHHVLTGREPRDRGEGVRDAARPFGLRQDDDAAPARGLPRARRRRDPGRRPASLLAARPRPARAAPHGHGVPELRHLAAHERVRERGLRPPARQDRPRRDRRAGRPGAGSGRPRGARERHPAQLSGGQQQRVALARSLVVEPSILLLDEPLSNLDAKLRERMRGELKSLQRRTGITFVYVTHDQAEAMALSDRIAVFHQGVRAAVRPPARDLRAPGQPVRRRLHGPREPAAGRDRRAQGWAWARAHRRAPRARDRWPAAAGSGAGDPRHPARSDPDRPTRPGRPEQPPRGQRGEATFLGNFVDYQIDTGGAPASRPGRSAGRPRARRAWA